jgi:hypothetical protein
LRPTPTTSTVLDDGILGWANVNELPRDAKRNAVAEQFTITD